MHYRTLLLNWYLSIQFRNLSFIVKLPAMEKTWRYVCTMTTHPNENTRRPCRQVKLSLAAGSVLMILLPLTMGLNASRHLSQNPEKITTEKTLKNSKIPSRRDINKIYMSTTFAIIFPLNRVFLLRMFCSFFDQLLTVFLSHRDPAILIHILIHEIIGLVVVIRHVRGLDVSHRGKWFVFIHGRTDHQDQYRAANGSKVTV